jgi:hypothetical protein
MMFKILVLQTLSHERQPVADLILDLLIGQVVSGASLTTASMSARKLSKGTRASSASRGSPLALSAFRRLSKS